MKNIEKQIEIESKMNELNENRGFLVNKKQKIEARLCEIKNKIRAKRLPPIHYSRLCKEQSSLMKTISELDEKLQKGKIVLKRLSLELHSEKLYSGNITTPLEELRNKYLEFSADHTRISSKRVMASEFVLELNKILDETS